MIRTVIATCVLSAMFGCVGEPGAMGEPGAEGPQGPAGEPGAKGDPGTAGSGGFVAASAERTGAVTGQGWTTIPGLSVTITLAKKSLVQSNSNGVQRAPNYNSTTNCHVGYRIAIDNFSRGDATWGERIQVSNGATSWHQTWSLIDATTLEAGTHTITVQTNQQIASNTSQCVVCGELNGQLTAYDSCTLNVMAIPQ